MKIREFVPGQRVLLLMHSDQAKLFATWQGPYEVIKRVGPVDYEIVMHDKTKKRGIFHVNLLKEWREREALWGEVDENEFEPEVETCLWTDLHLTIDETFFSENVTFLSLRCCNNNTTNLYRIRKRKA